MLTATEAQLQSITVKADQLEELMTQKIEEVRGLKRARDMHEQEVRDLRAKLDEAEARFGGVQSDLDQKTAGLKLVADEYNRAQLLKKKYHNTLAEHRGCPRVVVKIRDPAVYDGPQHNGGGSSGGGTRHDWGAVCVADACTINVPSKSKSFVFDSVLTPDDAQSVHDLFTQVNGQGMIHDVLTGYNTTLFTFGQEGAGKTNSLLGPAYDSSGRSTQAQGLVDVFISQLFQAMEHNGVDCFTIKAQMVELNNDVIYDLFADPSQATEQSPQYDILRDDKGRVHVPGVQQINVNVASQLSQLFHWGLTTKGKRHHADNLVGKSHIIFTCSIENYNKKGDFRRAKLTFIDLASPGGSAPDCNWVNKSHQALGDVISVLSTAAQQKNAPAAQRQSNVPYRASKLTMLMSDALGGNCKTTMLCCILPSVQQMEDLLTALIYAFHLKCVVNNVSPYDIPADLQKLEEQIRSIDFGGRGRR
eukprot:Rhum_TRINITY_DN10403_c0_g2::Rhum_TRINITY_DN10403_c0_g2_i1::g.38334::m.38334